ncbi:hypothetical protein [Streptomyces sp. NPDC005548]|uniref:hypothetical protein n=1 Tax=Streptomyces sp. NPDC005548 TaxID=3364724 RepID=UPI0036ADB9F7
MTVPPLSSVPCSSDPDDGRPGWDSARSTAGVDRAASADFVLTGRAMSAGVYLAGLVTEGLMADVGTPRDLPTDLWPDVDPVVVQAIFNRGAATGFHAAQVVANPERRREERAQLHDRFRRAGFEAMGAMGSRSLRLVSPEPVQHPADGESARGH